MSSTTPSKGKPSAAVLARIAVAFVVILIVARIPGCFQQVPPSSVGVKFAAQTGISTTLIRPQVVFVGPMEQLIIYPTNIKNSSYVRRSSEGEIRGDGSIKASTVEGATLPVDITVAWHIEPEMVLDAFNNFGTANLSEIEANFIRPSAIYAVNVVSGRKSIFDLTSRERATFGGEVKKVLEPILSEFGISVDDVYVGEVFPSDQVTGKVNERVAKRNELEKATISLQQAEIEAKTILTNARKQAELNKLLAQQGDQAIILRRIENRRKAIQAWDGNPSQVGEGRIPFTSINPKNLVGVNVK